MVAMRFVRRDLKLMVDRQLGQDAMSARLAQFAKSELAKSISAKEGTPNFERYVNGRKGVPEESVRPPGPVLYEFNWWPEIIVDAIDHMIRRSPNSPPGGHRGRVKSYKQSFFVLANGTGVHTRQYKDIPPGAEVIIGNDAPYSRKLDVQLIGGRKINVSVMPGFFEEAALIVRRRWGAIVSVKRSYSISFTGQYHLVTGPKTGTPVHSPALIITPR